MAELLGLGLTVKEDKQECPHCGIEMKKWLPPEDSGWDPVHQFVCFNDECSYYVKGWERMWNEYQQRASYRHRLDPRSEDAGPLAVWSPQAHRGRIIE